MKNLTAGQRISYYHYTTTYGYADDRTDTREQVRCGAITSVSANGKFAKIRSDASGMVVTVPTHRII